MYNIAMQRTWQSYADEFYGMAVRLKSPVERGDERSLLEFDNFAQRIEQNAQSINHHAVYFNDLKPLFDGYDLMQATYKKILTDVSHHDAMVIIASRPGFAVFGVLSEAAREFAYCVRNTHKDSDALETFPLPVFMPVNLHGDNVAGEARQINRIFMTRTPADIAIIQKQTIAYIQQQARYADPEKQDFLVYYIIACEAVFNGIKQLQDQYLNPPKEM